MREILFRGKRIDSGEWVEGYYSYSPNFLTHRIEWYKMNSFGSYQRTDAEVIPETVGQYTGLIDKNGTKIFEGDILPVWEQGEEYPYKVIYNADCFMLAMLDSEQGSYPLSEKHSQTEVIGNIHDNPAIDSPLKSP